MAQEYFSLKWNNYQENMTIAFKSLLEKDYFTDVTIHSGNKAFKAHRVVLSASSPYFEKLFDGLTVWQYPVVVLNHLKPASIQSILEYIYSGKVTIENTKLEEFMRVGSLLSIRGLTTNQQQTNSPRTETPLLQMVKITKSKRLSAERNSGSKKPKERKRSRSREKSLSPAGARAGAASQDPQHIVIDQVKEEPLDELSMSENAEMVVVKADPDDFSNPDGSYLRPEAAPLTVRNDLLQPKDRVEPSHNIFGETGRCHFCSEECGTKAELTDHLKNVHMPIKHALCENCENFFHVCAIQRHKLKCQARYQSDT